ncbi:bifunctional diaminohydroxyphosphoribosylaminopyrimidine deaminase/5-amino-6-(5-phosphoribosylamino)uracil reductase RibD [uncultured Desulfobulbus sp.]|uniref:bifunctional diaminohydroxyphosphoribosylaminopyrimidine deaminase/5-amino-6-(5-phosphoribosylamino)uracil reductase RibD n=1 Tax=uncultured Desulfobulbus sp. TaxID=239745 RepID=UPI0029C9788E|nr:bifunctional diaminohydroxyphosphoribosylaminopyrimidine deaminase/5-amino-6-(5-phosphoribosylamino)uracil reductase RibD [uncultured Desulfobulbus sp.]
MKHALTLAWRGHTSPNPMVGAVVVRDGAIVGEGYHPCAGEPHAEVFALNAAGTLTEGADLYVTLEPCSHFGRTPPCADAVIKAGIKRVFAAMVDPNPLVSGNGIKKLQNAGIIVEVGMIESEARELNRGFIKRVTTGRPFVLWKAAMSLDGKIAANSGDSRWITGERSRKEVHKLRNTHDAVITGVGTILADDPELNVRGIRGAVNPIKVVVDSKASTPPTARILKGDVPIYIAVTELADRERMNRLQDEGATIVMMPAVDDRVDLKALMIKLADLGINTAMLECGGELSASMLKAGLIDRGMIFVAPKIIGGRDAKSIVEGAGIEMMADALNASNLRTRRFGDDIALEFDFLKYEETVDPS